MGTRKARFLLVAAVPVVLYLLGRLGDAWAPNAAITVTGLAAVASYILIGIVVALALWFGLYGGVFILWAIIGFTWDTITWLRTGKSSDYFDRNHPLDAGKRDEE